MSSPGTAKSAKQIVKSRRLVRSNTLVDIINTETKTPEFNLAAFLLPARGSTSQWVVIPVIILITYCMKYALSTWGHSGEAIPPMHGDFEAQRHWMELTQHLPVSMWYFYDLQYWGLDYPPLTAYHSWLVGKMGSLIKPEWFALYASRGAESYGLKVFMRNSVVFSEALVFLPALIIFIRNYARNQGTGTTAGLIALIAILIQPSTMLIDHGHFQYNTVMLGFVVASLSSIYANRLLWSCLFFVAALMFKQMALYYAPVMFAFLLGSCLTPRLRPGRLFFIAFATIFAFALCLAPLLFGALYEVRPGASPLPYRAPPPFLAMRRITLDPKTTAGAISLQLSQLIHRIFPFARGAFESKVANFWCTLHTFYKLHNLEPYIQIPRLSGFLTVMSILPSMVVTLSIPAPSILPYSLASCAYGFFLFSFQVHEKSILLPLLPLTLLLASKYGLSKEYRAWIGFGNTLAVWTMYPLLARDELRTPYVVLTLFWAWLLGLPPCSVSCYYDPEHENVPGRPLKDDDLRTRTKILHFWMYILMAFWHLLNAFAETPEGKPDLWIVANAVIGCFGMVTMWLWSTWKMILHSHLLDPYFEHSAKYIDSWYKEVEEVAETVKDRVKEVQEEASEAVSSSRASTPGKGSAKKRSGGKKK